MRKTFHWQGRQLSMRLPSQASMRGACRAQCLQLAMFACRGWRSSLQSYGKNTSQCEQQESVRGGERIKSENTCKHSSLDSALVAVLARAAATPPASAPSRLLSQPVPHFTASGSCEVWHRLAGEPRWIHPLIHFTMRLWQHQETATRGKEEVGQGAGPASPPAAPPPNA